MANSKHKDRESQFFYEWLLVLCHSIPMGSKSNQALLSGITEINLLHLESTDSDPRSVQE